MKWRCIKEDPPRVGTLCLFYGDGNSFWVFKWTDMQQKTFGVRNAVAWVVIEEVPENFKNLSIAEIRVNAAI